MNEEYTRQQKRLGKMFVAFALFQIVVLFLATIAWAFLPWLGMLGRTENEVQILMMTPLFGGWAFSIISIVLFVPSLVAGIALINGREFGYGLGFVTAVAALIEIPFGTIFGIYAIRRLKSLKRVSTK